MKVHHDRFASGHEKGEDEKHTKKEIRRLRTEGNKIALEFVLLMFFPGSKTPSKSFVTCKANKSQFPRPKRTSLFQRERQRHKSSLFHRNENESERRERKKERKNVWMIKNIRARVTWCRPLSGIFRSSPPEPLFASLGPLPDLL